MGYDITRFQGEVDEDLLCPICSGVLEEPVQVSHPLKIHQPITQSAFFLNFKCFCCVLISISGPTL